MNILRLVLFILLFSGLAGCSKDRPERTDAVTSAQLNPQQISSSQIKSGQDCQDCHAQQVHNWQSSDHAKAMQEASQENVSGNFEVREILVDGEKAKFFTKNNQYWVTLKNAEGQDQDYKIAFTFGHDPIQQYVVKTHRGKYQILPFTWDNRPRRDGGQRWFQLNSGEHSRQNSRLHWTQPLQNWNGMCADCHSVGLKRNYDKAKDQFQTTWDSVNVSCAGCHDPKTVHDDERQSSQTKGSWQFSNARNTAHWVGEERGNQQINTCAACHSRRSPLTDGFSANDDFLDKFSPRLITQPEYFADGQINDEVYVWGSFLQSKMFQNGVICSDCHNPHSLDLKAKGNELCAQCHKPQVYDTKAHHHHDIGSAGAQCVDCHMTQKTYMGVDERRDHSFRIPRPHLTQTTGSPNACTSCHSDKKPDWASATINKWNGATPSLPIHYGQVFHDIQNNQKGAKARLTTLINSSETPVIMRASGYTLLEHGPQNIQTLASGLNSQEPLIRLGAVRGAYGNPLARALLYPLLNDRYRAVRVEVVRSLALSDPTILPRRYQEAYEKAEQEFIQAENQAAWRGEGRMNIGLYFQQSGKEQQAIKAYYASTKLDPYFAPSYVNLANIFYGQGLDAKGGEWLKKGLVNTPDDPDLNFAQGLYLIRQAQGQDALSHLAKAVLHAPDNARYSYVYGVALYDLGQAAKAKSILTQALSYAPDHDDILYYLMTINIAQKNYSDALIYAEKLLARYPNNATIQEQVAKIKIELDKSK